MNDFASHLTGAKSRHRNYPLRPIALVVAPVVAILFQVYSPRFIPFLQFLDLPLLVTVYFAVKRREPIPGILIGALIGLAQDAFSHNPIGLYGIVKTLTGYSAASLSQHLDGEDPGIRFLVGFGFYFLHQICYWVLSNALLAQDLPIDLLQALLFGVLNAAVAVPLFGLLDKL